MKQYRIQYEKEITGIVRDETIVYAESKEEAERKFEEQDIEYDVIKVQEIQNNDPRQLEFDFAMPRSPFERLA